MSSATKIRVQATIIVLIAFFAALFAYPQGPNWIRDEVKLHLGLDLAGGAHLVYQADVTEIPEADRESAVQGTRDVIEQRVNALGVGEPVVQTNVSGDGYRIIVELPGVTDVNEAIDRIGDTPVLEFKEAAEPIPLTEAEIAVNTEKNKAQQAKAEATLNQVIDFQDAGFADRAKEISEDAGSRDAGGDLGFVGRGTFIPEFEAILFDKMKDGETYPEVVETQFGYHIIRRLASQCKNNTTGEVTPCAPGDATIVPEVHGSHILFLKEPIDFRQPPDPWVNTKLSGEHLKRASVQFDPQTSMPLVSIEFNDEGGNLFEEITAKNIGKNIAIFLDGNPISAPTVQQEITGDSAVITGNFTIPEAQELVRRLNAGALPVNIELVSQQTIGATLGQDSIQHSFLAGLFGLILVITFMIGYYRLPGLVASLSLIIYTLLIITVFKLVPVTLTLSGIAGFILSIGLAVDANVLIFERLKEELRAGKTLQASIDEGFSRAWSSIRDSNISTLITAFILVWLGESLIKGFGLTLAIGVGISMFTAITITRTFLKLIARQGAEGGFWWGRI